MLLIANDGYAAKTPYISDIQNLLLKQSLKYDKIKTIIFLEKTGFL